MSIGGSISTLSTGLNKSDEFIKENATHLHTRIVTFRNNKKINLDQHTAIPAAEDAESAVRYLRCESITYFPDYDVCHKDIRVQWSHTNSLGGNFPPQTATISAADVNAQGIMAAVAKALQPAYIHVLTGGEGNSYQGIRFAWAPGTIYQFHMTYLAAWLCGIIPTYTYEQENQFYVVYDLSSDTAEFINVLNHNIITGNTSRIVFPLLNGGINRLTISSDELATSQYINGHKTATIAEIQLRPSTQVKYPNVPNWQRDIIEYFLVPHPQSNDGITLPDIGATPDFNVLSKRSSFHHTLSPMQFESISRRHRTRRH